MKSELSALDIYYLRKEWNKLINSKVDKVYLKEDDMLLQLHLPGVGRRMLKIILPDFIYLTEYKKSYGHPNRFCMSLRKYLGNSRLRKIKQKDFERILEFHFETKHGISILIIELFSKGNVILCKKDYTIIIAKEYQKWSQRTIRGGIKYEYPDKESDITDIKFPEFKKLIENSDKESVVKTLAIDFGLGGVYSEEICHMAGIDKSKKKPDEKEIKKLYKAVEQILDKKIKAVVYIKKDITPFSLEKYKGLEKKEFDSFNRALDSTLTKKIKKKEVKKVKKKVAGEKNRIRSILNQQTGQIKGFKKAVKTNQKKAELIYEKYKLIEEILKEINKAKKKYSEKEIKKILKDHPVIKMVDLKNKEVTVDL
ncbi:hypothetical protein GF327_07820 [Candidatus Woesearchaeota archaeon]|nr:hypothetical protein [Candidatus Woesearchaeota archaeon]